MERKINNKNNKRKLSQDNKRIRVFLVLASFLFLFVLLRLFQLQVIMGRVIREESYSIRKGESVITAQRGSIYDTNGIKLATDTSIYSLWMDPSYLRQNLKKVGITKYKAAEKIGEKLNLDKNYVLRKIELNSGFVWLKKEVSFEEVRNIKELKIIGLYFKEEGARYYPGHALGGNLLGFVNTSGDGIAGIEATFNDILRGQDGYIKGEKDGQSNYIPDTIEVLKEEVSGDSIVLTIDQKAQYIVDRELNNIKNELIPTSAIIMIMETKTGAIIASGNTNSYDPNNYATTDDRLFSTLEFQSVFEPGSTMKIITSSAAVNEGVVNKNTTFYDNGYRTVADRIIKCWTYPKYHGTESLMDGLANSCNSVYVDVAMKLKNKGKDIWFNYLKRFGFGQQSAIKFVGESAGIMPHSTNEIYQATSAIGQGIAVTSIQMLTAVSAVANDGQKMKPYLVKEIKNSKGETIQKNEPTIECQLVSKETAEVVQSMMKEAVERGTGKKFQLNNNIASMGKTGTAEKVDETTGTYYKGKYVISFIGVAPYDDPKYTVLIIIDNAQKGGDSSSAVAKYYRAVMESILFQNSVSSQDNIAIASSKVIVPNFIGQKINDANRIADKLKIKIKINGTGFIVSQSEPHFSIISGDKVLVLNAEEKTLSNEQAVVPGLHNLRLLEAIKIVENSGLKFKYYGRGKVLEQNLNPGCIMNKNMVLAVRLGE